MRPAAQTHFSRGAPQCPAVPAQAWSGVRRFPAISKSADCVRVASSAAWRRGRSRRDRGGPAARRGVGLRCGRGVVLSPRASPPTATAARESVSPSTSRWEERLGSSGQHLWVGGGSGSGSARWRRWGGVTRRRPSIYTPCAPRGRPGRATGALCRGTEQGEPPEPPLSVRGEQ